VPVEDDVMSPSTKVFSFPIKSPDGAVTASEMGAMEQLELWEIYQDFWCEHKPSMTCYYRDDEFLEVGQWLYNKFDKISGVSFLPYSEHTYQQAPYEPIDEETYEMLKAEFPETIDWNISENSDNTEGSQTLACTGNNCEI
jgi:ribonucleoside-diphosphate reductase alpha chain